MDPISQGVLGATWSLNGITKKNKSEIVQALWLGCLSGMAPDLDVLIRSSQDPLLFLEYHRHFTHSLAFIPFGALICVLVLKPLFKLFNAKPLPWLRAYLYCFLGYASHALLDACTSYGTQLFLPFSNMRVAWDVISIIDPLYTLPLIFFVTLAALRKKLIWVRCALIYSMAYIVLGFVQHHRAINLLKNSAESRRHAPIRIHTKPSFANMILYRGIYETEDKFYVDAIRVPYWGTSTVIEGFSIPKFKFSDLTQKGVAMNSTLWKDVERFAWFSDHFLVWSPDQENTISDLRYSMLPDSQNMLWGIKINPTQQEQHVEFINFRDVDDTTLHKFKKMLFN